MLGIFRPETIHMVVFKDAGDDREINRLTRTFPRPETVRSVNPFRSVVK